MTTALAYLRQSVARQKDDRDGGSVSLAYQLDAATKWCQAHGAALIAHHSDLDESGASTTRKGLDAFLADVDQLKPDYAVFWDLKRLSRNLKLFLDVFDRLAAAGTELVSVTEGSKNPAFVWKMLALVAEEERDRIAANITHGKREATKRGRHLGFPPLGFRRGEDGVLVIDEETAWIIRWMFDRCLEGHTPTAICRMANEQGIPTSGTVRAKRGGDAVALYPELPPPVPGAPGPTERCNGEGSCTPTSTVIPETLSQWSRRTVTSVLRRPTYTGLVQSGQCSRSRYGKALGIVIAEAPHEPIIDRRTWESVQARLDGLSQPTARRGSWHWLAGRVTCAACGAPMYFVRAMRTNGYPDVYWRCRNSYGKTFGRTNQQCPAAKSRVPDNLLSQWAVDALSGLLTHAARQTRPELVAQRLARQNGTQRVTAREQGERRLADLQAQRLRINDAIQQGVGELPDLAQRDRALIAAIEETRTELASLPEPVSLPVIVSSLRIAHAAAREWESATEQDRATLATRMGLTVTVDTDAGTVALDFAEPFRTMLRGS